MEEPFDPLEPEGAEGPDPNNLINLLVTNPQDVLTRAVTINGKTEQAGILEAYSSIDKAVNVVSYV